MTPIQPYTPGSKGKGKKNIPIGDLLFDDYAELVAHSARDLQTLLSQFRQHAQISASPLTLKKLKS